MRARAGVAVRATAGEYGAGGGRDGRRELRRLAAWRGEEARVSEWVDAGEGEREEEREEGGVEDTSAGKAHGEGRSGFTVRGSR